MASESAVPPGVVLNQNVHVYEEAIERFKQTISSTDAAAFQATSPEDVWKVVEIQAQIKSRWNLCRVEPFLKDLEEYSKFVEISCNGTSYLPWIWGPIKLMLQISIELIHAFDKLLDVYELIGHAMPQFGRLQGYQALLFNQPHIQAILAVVYEIIIEFHCQLYKDFRRRTWKIFSQSLWKDHKIQLKNNLKRLSDHKELLYAALNIAAIRTSHQHNNALSRLIRDAIKVNKLYRPLSFEKAEIRLLKLTFANTEAALQCSLITVPLPKSPPYIALSYTWGDPADTVPIIVNNFEVQITDNLRTALLRLRAEGVTHIWADALCINQGDSEERTAQVGRMGTIFRKASEVAVWLGHEQRIMEQALRFSHASQSGNLDEKSRLSSLPIFKELLSQPYWKRVWIIQEIAVASHISIYCGEYRIGWDKFIEMCRFGAGGNALTTEDQSKDETISEFTTLLKLRNDTLARQPVRFLDALYRSRSSLSTDPRDKLYALLGLTYDGRHFIPEPNYMNSVAESFTDFATALIESGEPLDFIYLRSASRRNNGELPSWVPDWTDLDNAVARQQLDYIMHHLFLHPKDSESNHVRKPAEIDNSRSVLTVHGVFVDTVDDLGSAISTNDGNTTDYATIMSDEALLPTVASNAAHLVHRIMMKSSIKPAYAKHEKHLVHLSRRIEFGFSLDDAWEDAAAQCDKDRSFISGQVMKRFEKYSSKLEDGYIRLFWRFDEEEQIYSTQFFVQENLWAAFVLGRDACDKPVHDEKTQRFRSAVTAEYGRQLKESLVNDIPRELLAPFNTWLSENYSFMMDGQPAESWSKTYDFKPCQTRDASEVVLHFFKIMQLGMRLLRTEKGLLGWIHPMAQQGDRIARVFGCSQFVVLRAHSNGCNYQVVGDALLSGVKVEDMDILDDDQVHCLQIL